MYDIEVVGRCSVWIWAAGRCAEYPGANCLGQLAGRSVSAGKPSTSLEMAANRWKLLQEPAQKAV